MAQPSSISPLVLDEAFARQDDNFVDLIRSFHEPKKLATFADRWAKDHRPWAREKFIDYVNRPWNCEGHEPLIKRVFKYAEAQRDDELMGIFLERFDTYVRRVRKTRYQYDFRTRQSWQEEVLYSAHDREMFSYRTRYHLRRRAWRYFRRMGFQRPSQYVPAISRALVRYKDGALARGENLVDSWGLIHACFGKSDVIEFTPSLVRVRAGKRLADLTAEPYFPKLWQSTDAAGALISIVLDAQARPVRIWAMQLLRRWHQDSLTDLPAERLLAMLDHADSEVQQFGAQLFSSSKLLGTLPLETWLKLLGTTNLTALEMIVAAMEKHVAPDRLSLAQLVEMACARPVPVVRLALKFLQARAPESDDQRATIADLSRARCESEGAAIAKYALSILAIPNAYQADHIIHFFDSQLVTMRQTTWDWLTKDSPGWNDPALWSKLIESPYDDVRLKLVAALQQRAGAPGIDDDAQASLWCSVLLGIHRGGRTKLIALNQISRQLSSHPERAEQLLPVVACAIRSVRVPEARGGLSAIVSAVELRPEIEPLIAKFLPELKLAPKTGAAA